MYIVNTAFNLLTIVTNQNMMGCATQLNVTRGIIKNISFATRCRNKCKQFALIEPIVVSGTR